MNKVILGLILAVCVLGMALVMLNERLGKRTDDRQPAASSQVMSENGQELDKARQGGEEPSVFAPLAPPPMAVTEPDIAIAPPNDRAEPDPARIPQEFRSPVDTADFTGISQTPPVQPESESVAVEKQQPVAETKPAPAPRPAPAAQPAPAPKKKEVAEKARETPSAKGQPAGKGIKQLVIYARDKGATVRIGGASRMNYKSMTLENPDRVVLDLDGEWTFPDNIGIPKNELVNNVRIGKLGDKTRVVIDLKAKPRSSRVIQAKSGNSIDIRVDK